MELDRQIRDWRDQALNKLLAAAWEEYLKAVGDGEVLELESSYEAFVKQALDESVELEVNAA